MHTAAPAVEEKRPAAHGTQTDVAAPLEWLANAPGPHGAQVLLLLLTSAWPSGHVHATQELTDVAPIALLPVPAGQSRHLPLLKGPSQYVFRGHMQAPGLFAPGRLVWVFTGHGWHASLLAAPVSAPNESCGHGTHANAPLEFEYDPAEHLPHTPLPDPDENVPGSQRLHADEPEEPMTLAVPAGQKAHAPSEVAPTVGPYVPGGHARQYDTLAATLPSLYVPAGHFTATDCVSSKQAGGSANARSHTLAPLRRALQPLRYCADMLVP